MRKQLPLAIAVNKITRRTICILLGIISLCACQSSKQGTEVSYRYIKDFTPPKGVQFGAQGMDRYCSYGINEQNKMTCSINEAKVKKAGLTPKEYKALKKYVKKQNGIKPLSIETYGRIMEKDREMLRYVHLRDGKYLIDINEGEAREAGLIEEYIGIKNSIDSWNNDIAKHHITPEQIEAGKPIKVGTNEDGKTLYILFPTTKQLNQTKKELYLKTDK